MSDTIDWQKLTDEERNALIHTEVLSLPLEVLCTELEINHNGYTFWCVSCKKEGQDLLHVPHFRAIPAYSTSLDAAWLAVREMNKPIGDGYDLYASFIDELEKIVGSNYFFDLFFCDAEDEHLSPERVCIAALRAVGVEVTTA